MFLCLDNLCIHWFASLKPGMQGADINHAMEVCLFSTEICISKDEYICVLVLVGLYDVLLEFHPIFHLYMG